MTSLDVPGPSGRRWDLVSLGEVMLRLDPGSSRVSTARSFTAWEGGGEYNVARGLKRCFGLDTAIVSVLVDNAVGRLIQDLIYQGGVDQAHLRWAPFDGVGRSARNGLNFTERGFGPRAPAGCSDRGQSAASQMKPGDMDWHRLFGQEGARWFHTGGIFAALSATTSLVAQEAMAAASHSGAVVSYDLNFRESLWKASGGRTGARAVNRELAALADVLVGNEEDYSAALGIRLPVEGDYSQLDLSAYEHVLAQTMDEFPSLKVAAITLRKALSATRNDWSAICRCDGASYRSTVRTDLEVYDRVGGGDSFASGFFYAYLTGQGPQRALELGAAHGALAMTTPGDTSMATLAEVEKAAGGGAIRISR